MKKIGTITIAGQVHQLDEAMYGNNRVAILIDDGRWGKLTVNLPDVDVPAGHILVKTWEENRNLREPALATGFFEDTAWRVACGLAVAELWKYTPPASQMTVKQGPFSDQVREALRDALSAALGDAMDCTRAWSAWGVGTMSENDFQLLADNDERLDELVDAVLEQLAKHVDAPAPRTNLSKRIREAATADVTLTQAKLLIGAAEEIERAQQSAEPGALLAMLRDVHDTLSSESDSDIDHFEDDEEEREGAPVQYAARKVMEVMDMLKAAASTPGMPEADLSSLQKWWYTFDGMQPSETSETSDQIYYAVEDIQAFIASRAQPKGKWVAWCEVQPEIFGPLVALGGGGGARDRIGVAASEQDADAIVAAHNSALAMKAVQLGWKMGDAGWEPIVYPAAQQAAAPGALDDDATEVLADLLEAAEAMIDVLDEYPEQLVPINRKSGTVNSLRKAIAAQHDGGQGGGQ